MSEILEDFDNIIPFIKKENIEPLLGIKKEIYPTCFCLALDIDEPKNEIICRNCNKIFTPMQALLKYARYHTRYSNQLKSIHKELEDKSKELERLKMDVHNAKAAFSRASQKLHGQKT